MVRQEKLKRLLDQMMAEQIKQSCDRVTVSCEQHRKEIIAELLVAITVVVEQVLHLQTSGKKGKIKYLLFSYLNSGLVLGSHRISIQGLDERFYCDPGQAVAYLHLDAIYQWLEQDVERFIEQIKLQVPSLFAYEIEMIRSEYGQYYHQMVGQLLKELLEGADRMQLFHEILLENQVQVLFGGYMDTVQQLALWK